ncbi:MAG TPA: CoA-binding protein, partial [Dehalococcoidia bacterium]|nr:CoA-binding protein [Dehalococcoidia bacterium]
DLAIIVTPPGAAAEVVADCGRAGVRAAALFTAGFGELGSEEGDRRERELVAAAESAGVRLIGPNCMGVYSPSVGLASFTDLPMETGDVGFISQSGSLTNFFARESMARGFAVSKAVSVGNQLDLDAADFLTYLAGDDATRVICMYVEGPPDSRALFEALRAATQRKPVVLWKSGRTEGGSRAARSHTGALAGSYAIWQAMIRQTGTIEARTIQEMVDLVVALRMQPRPRGDRLGVVTGPGGPSISAVDAAEEAGLRLATLDASTIEQLAGAISAVGTSPKNPVDVGLILYGPMDIYGEVTAIAGGDPNVDGAIVLGGSSTGPEGEAFLSLMRGARDGFRKPLAQVTLRPPVDAQLAKAYGEVGVGLFPTAERAVQAYAGVSAYEAFRAQIS